MHTNWANLIRNHIICAVMATPNTYRAQYLCGDFRLGWIEKSGQQMTNRSFLCWSEAFLTTKILESIIARRCHPVKHYNIWNMVIHKSLTHTRKLILTIPFDSFGFNGQHKRFKLHRSFTRSLDRCCAIMRMPTTPTIDQPKKKTDQILLAEHTQKYVLRSVFSSSILMSFEATFHAMFTRTRSHTRQTVAVVGSFLPSFSLSLFLLSLRKTDADCSNCVHGIRDEYINCDWISTKCFIWTCESFSLPVPFD